ECRVSRCCSSLAWLRPQSPPPSQPGCSPMLAGHTANLIRSALTVKRSCRQFCQLPAPGSIRAELGPGSYSIPRAQLLSRAVDMEQVVQHALVLQHRMYGATRLALAAVHAQ